ncbi:hypothetical protein EUX98_g4168 [Antrodiella citrinella]|uniref:PH domain-containing protein n=1 Tax=Antrodiella citrinella TaxID=2447956 RepID=A0A4S4MUM8_9APHY|nr:hypothetical protein EUX98_g4168 [Antrodiella citrinella]
MPPSHIHRIVLAARPKGSLNPSEVFRTEIIPYDLHVNDDEVIVQTEGVSIDAGFRVWLDEGMPLTISIGEVMRGSGVGVVREVGKACKVAVGDHVYYRPGWQDWGVYKESTLTVLKLSPGIELVDYIGALGASGLSAYVDQGLILVAKLKLGETLLVSSAAGAVGHVACQIGKILGAKVIGIAGSSGKCAFLEQEYGLDKALNYKSSSFQDDLKAVGGIDVYFDNVGGEILDLVMTQMNQLGRIALCGTLSRINGKEPPGLKNYMHLILQSAKIEGFFTNGPPQPDNLASPTPSQQPQSPPSPQTPMTPSTPGAAKPPPQLHPEIRSIVQLTASHTQKVYFSGPIIRKVEHQPDGQKPTKDEGWRNVWGQLGGTTLSLWDMKEIEEASKQGRQVPPSYVNVTDAFVHVVGTLTIPGSQEVPPQTYANVFSVNTAGLNLLLFSCPSTQALVSWTAALRLAAWEKSRLEEMYTAHLIRIMLNDGRETRSPLVRGKMEGWVRIRVAGQTDWKKLWMVVSAAGVLQDTGSMSSSDNRPTSPNTPKKNRLSQLFSREQSPPRSSATPSRPLVQVFASQKPKDKKKALLTFKDVAQAFAVYPERPELISRSTLMKLEGVFGDEEMVGSMRNREAWLLVMPELEANNTRASEMLKWLIAIHDAFELYGRPRIYSWDPRDPESTMFAYPIGPNRELLFLDRELAESLDPRDDRTSAVRRQLRQIQWQRMNGSGPMPEKAQPPIPAGNHPPTLPPLPVMLEETEYTAASGSRLPEQSSSGAPQLSMQIPPLDFERTPEVSSEPTKNAQRTSDPPAPRPLTPITERSNPPDSRSMSGDTNLLSTRQSVQHSPPGPVPSYSPPPPPEKLTEAVQQDQDGVFGGRMTTSPVPASPPADARPFGYRPSEEPHFVVASRPTSKQGRYGSPKPADVQLPSSPEVEQHVPVAASEPSQPFAISQPQPQHQRIVSPPPATSPSHVSQKSLSPPPPVHSPHATSPPASIMIAPHSVRDSVHSGGPRFSMASPPTSPSRVQSQSYSSQRTNSADALSSPTISHSDNAPPPSPARSSMVSSSLQASSQRRELRNEPSEENVLGNEAGALYYMRHVDGDAPPPTGIRRPPPPPTSDDEEEEEEEDSDDSPSIYTPPATNAVNPLNIRKSPSPPPKVTSAVYSRRGTPSPLPTSPTNIQHTRTFSPTSPMDPGMMSGSRPPEPPSRYGSVAKPSGARAPGNKMASAGSPPLVQASTNNTRRDDEQQSSSFRQRPSRQHSSSPVFDSEEVPEDEDIEQDPYMSAQHQHSELGYENDPPQGADASYEDTADALAALNFLEQDEVPPPAQVQRKPGLPSSPAPVAAPSSEPLPDTTSQQQRSSFAPSRIAAERKAKSQAQQAAHQAAVTKPGRANGKAKRKTHESGTWGESSDEEEEEEEEDDDDADSDEELPPRHRALQNANASNGQRPGYPSTQSMQSMQMSQGGQGQNMGGYGQERRPRDLPQLPGQMSQGPGEDYLNQPQPRRMQERSLYPNEAPRRQTSPLSQMTRPLNDNPQYHLAAAPAAPRQNMWSQVLEPGAKINPQARETFIQVEPPSQTMTKAFMPHGLLSAGIQDKEDRSAKRQEELARETGASLINVPNKPPPPQTGLLGAVAAHEREKRREGGIGATLTEREREKRLAEDRQRKLDDYQRMQLDQMQQGGGSMYGGMGYPGFNPMMNPMMANPMMMGMNPMMTGAGWGGYPGMMAPQQMMAAQQAAQAYQQAAQAYQQAMMAFSAAGSQVGGEGGSPAPLNPMMTGGSMFDPRMSMMGMMNPMAMGGMSPGMGGGMTPGMGGGMGGGMNPMMGGGMGMQMTGGGSPYDPRFSAGFDTTAGAGLPHDNTPPQRPYSSQNNSSNGRGSPAAPKGGDSMDDLPRPGGQ